MSTHAHIASSAIYAKVLGALLALTIITVLAAGVNFGSGNVWIALLIASAKASLVALYFMHLRHDKPMSAIIFVTSLVMLALFLAFAIIDTEARDRIRPSHTRPLPISTTAVPQTATPPTAEAAPAH
jgi:cytochrome c oxidase subunit 4